VQDLGECKAVMPYVNTVTSEINLRVTYIICEVTEDTGIQNNITFFMQK